jgi:hypothetical protein
MMRIYIISCLLLVYGCAGTANIQKAEDLVSKKEQIKKAVCIDPDIIYFTNSTFTTIDYKKTNKYQPFFLSRLNKYANKSANFSFDIQHPWVTDSLGTDYFNSLLPLKFEILQTLFERDNEINSNPISVFGSAIKKTVFADVPKISPEYSYLSKKYNTPYFSWYGIFSSPNHSVLIFVVVNVETSEAVVREVVYLAHSFNKRNLPPVLYDSFKFIK